MTELRLDRIDHFEEFSADAEAGEARGYHEAPEIILPETIYHQHQEALFAAQIRLSSAIAPDEATAARLLTELGIPLLSQDDKDKLVQDRIDEIASPYDEVLRAKASYEMRRGNISGAGRFAREVTDFDQKLVLFEEAGELGELDVMASLGYMREEAEAAPTTEPLIHYLCTEVRLGWNVGVNSESLAVLLEDPSVGDQKSAPLEKSVIKTLIETGNESAIAQAKRIYKNNVGPFMHDWGTRLGIVLAQKQKAEILDKPDAGRDGLRGVFRRSEKTRILKEAWEETFLNDSKRSSHSPKLRQDYVQAWVVRDILEPDSDASEAITRNLMHVTDYADGAQYEYLRKTYGKELYALGETSKGRSGSYKTLANNETLEGLQLALERGDTINAERLYAKRVKRGLDDLQLLQMAMELALQPGAQQGQDIRRAAETQAHVELVAAKRDGAAQHVMDDRVDQSRFRQEYNDQLDELFERAKEVADPLLRFQTLAQLMSVQQLHDSEAPKWRSMQAELQEVAIRCTESPIACIVMSPDDITKVCGAFGVDYKVQVD